MTHLNTNAVTENAIVDKAQKQFALEDHLEFLLRTGMISDDEYDHGISKIFYCFADMYGFNA
jgi:hypothetical protein